MKIILSPAKKMKTDTDSIGILSCPVFMEKTEEILSWLKGRTEEELQKMWKCNDNIAAQNIERINSMNMAPVVFENAHFDYVQEHLRIMSAFYGVLKPMDGITPYRLEMQAKASIGHYKNLYEFWGEMLYREVMDDSGIIINLASKEYSKCIEKYLTPADRYITITFCEKSGDKLITKGTYAKMARGEMVRYMAENHIEKPDDIRSFNRLGYVFRGEISSGNEYIFERIVE